MNKLISIVVPVYEVEKYLKKCVHSILNQTYNNLEIILVDDGSPDRCGLICDEYAQKDNRVKVIHKENGGLSDARNVGIKASLGDYIMFVDSDDYIELNSAEYLVEYMDKLNLDIVCSNTWKKIDENETYNKPFMYENKVISGEEYIAHGMSTGNIFSVVCNKMYRTKLIKDNEIYFKEGLLHEDEDWTPRILLKANKVMSVEFCFYNYVIREGSITQKVNKEKNIKDIMKICFRLEDVYRTSDIDQKNKKLFLDNLSNIYMLTANLGEYKREFYLKHLDKKFVIRNASRFKTNIKMLIFLTSIPAYRQIENIRKL